MCENLMSLGCEKYGTCRRDRFVEGEICDEPALVSRSLVLFLLTSCTYVCLVGIRIFTVIFGCQ